MWDGRPVKRFEGAKSARCLLKGENIKGPEMLKLATQAQSQ